MEQIKVGAVFRFAKADRRVVGIKGLGERGFTVQWAYEDGKPRGAKTGGEQWCHYFRSDAISELPQDGSGVRTLLSGRQVACEAVEKQISVSTKCPRKWALVDLETGDVWVSVADTLMRAPEVVLNELAVVAEREKEER